ncbi:MAG: ELM1/GtrOC1 family putative glycosyltransferase [Candidatus Poribacteria bacterium]
MKILIISDGRPGHYNQSLGIVSHIKDVEFYLIEVKFRSKRRDNLLRIFMRLLGWMPMPEGFIVRLLKMALSQESAAELLTCEDYDIILSTGSSVAPINLLMGKLIDAYTVVCTRPSPLGFAYFDLAILPQHHWPRIKRQNVCKTLGVPNLITPEDIERRRQRLRSKLNLPDKLRFGVLLGGEDRYFTITPSTAEKLLDTLLKACDEIDGQIALTTSRRTPPVVEELLLSRLDVDNRCALLELASGTYPRSRGKNSRITEPVESIFAISDTVIVTEDSFSMVCEAASSGRKIIILDIDRKSKRRPKRHHTYDSIMQSVQAVRCDIGNLEKVLLTMAHEEVKFKALRDAQTAADAIVRTFQI